MPVLPQPLAVLRAVGSPPFTYPPPEFHAVLKPPGVRRIVLRRSEIDAALFAATFGTEEQDG
jgi:hypothetical protein